MNFKDFLFQYKTGEDVHKEEVKGKTFIVGRSSRCNITIDLEIISRKHMQVFFEDDSIKIKDLGSTNGTFINGTKLKPHTKFEYETGDELFVEGAGLRCDFEIKSLLEERSKSCASIHELENSEISLDESEKPELEMEGVELHEESLVKDGDDSIVNIPSRGEDSGNNSISGFSKNQSKEGLGQNGDSIEGMIDNSQSLKDQISLAESEISDLKGLSAKSEKDVQKRKIDIKNLEDEIIQKQRELEGELENKQSEEELNQLLEEEGSIHFINEMKQQEIQDFHNEVASPRFQNSDKELKKRGKSPKIGVKKISEKELRRIREEYKKSLDGEFNDLRIRTRLEAREEAIFIIEKAKKDIENRVKQSEEEADNKVEEAKKIAKEIIHQAQDQADSDFEAVQREIEERKKKADIEIENLYSEIEEERKQLEKESEKVRQEAQREVNLKLKDMQCELEIEMDRRIVNRLKEIEKEALKRMKEVEDERVDRMKKVDVEAENKLREAEKRAENRLREVEREVKNRFEGAEKQAQEIISHKMDDFAKSEKDFEKRKKEADEEVKAFYSQMKMDKERFDQQLKKIKQDVEKEVIRDSDKLKLEIEAKIKVDTDRKLEEAGKQAREIVARAHQQADNRVSVSEQEIDKKRKQVDDEIHNLRLRTIKKFEDQRRTMEEEENKRNRLRAECLQKELAEVLRVRIQPHLRNEESLNQVSAIIDESVSAVILGKIDNDSIEDKYDVNSDLYKKKVGNFWKLSGLAFVTVAVFFVFLPTFKDITLQTERDIATQDAGEVGKKTVGTKTGNNFNKEFQPDKVNKFLGNYTDRVLYTRDYVAIELFEEYREKWSLELRNYFSETLGFGENYLSLFIAGEFILIRELDEAMKKIDNHSADKGIARMREIEAGFEKKLQKRLGQKGNYEKVMVFKRAFFKENADKFRKKISSSK